MDSMEKKYGQKRNKKKDNVEKKLNIIESNCKLSDEEKYESLKALKKKLLKEQARTEKSQNIKDVLYGLNSVVGQQLPSAKSLLAIASVGLIAMGGLFLAGPAFGAIAHKVFGGIALGIGSLIGTSAVLNTEFGRHDSAMETMFTNSFYKTRYYQMGIEDSLKIIDDKIQNYENNLSNEIE